MSLYSLLLGCGCSSESSSLVNVVQHCCISSEREAVHELVEQQRVIGDPVTVEEEAWLAWSTPRVLDSTGCRQKMLVRPERTRRRGRNSVYSAYSILSIVYIVCSMW